MTKRDAARRAEAAHVLAIAAIQEGRPQEAVEHLKRVIALIPDAAPAYANLGVAYRALGRTPEAVASAQRAVKLAPAPAPYWLVLGHALLQAEKWSEAADAYAGSVARGGQGFDLHMAYGQALKNCGRYAEACEQFMRARALQPRDTRVMALLGETRLAIGDHAGAVEALRPAFAQAPDSYEIANNLGCALTKIKVFAESEQTLLRAVALKPDLPDTWLNLGTALQFQDRYDDALAAFERALAIDTGNTQALFNIALVHEWKGDLAAARDVYARVLEQQPDHHQARKYKALTHLSMGEMREGWLEYEARWKCTDTAVRHRPHSQPAWDGRRDLPGTLLVWGEQGVGDEILFGTMMSDLVEHGPPVIWEADPRIVPLLRRSFPAINVIPSQPTPDPRASASDVRAQIPVGGLGRVLRPDLSAFPSSPRPYLQADPARVRGFREKLLQHAPKGTRLVGISWRSGSPDLGVEKSTSLASWAPILRTPGTCFVDLQFGDTATERADVAASLGVTVHHVPELDLFNDLDSLAALIAACDLVVTVSNTNTHFAGALGIPAWVLVPKGRGRLWYWGQQGEVTPWYASVRLFRQTEPGQWTDVIEGVAARLQKRV